MSIDIYFAGKPPTLSEDYMLNNRCNRLLSFVNERKLIDTWISCPTKGKLFIDSGAFSVWTKGKKLDVGGYINFLNEYHNELTIYAQVDVIPGERGRKATHIEVRDASARSWENYLYMRDKLVEPNKLIYAFHAGEPFSYLEQALKNKIPYIALGGLVGKTSTTKENFLQQCFKLINELHPQVKTHVFGITTFNLLSQHSITSADSTSYIQCGCNGNILCDYGVICLSDRKQFGIGQYLQLSPQYKEKIEQEVRKYGFTVEGLTSSYNDRILYNIIYTKKQAEKLVTIKKIGSKKLF